jgi:hypothetical protein
MTPVLSDSALVPAGSAARSLTLAELLRLPAATDVVTAGRALGIGRTASYELAGAGRFPCRVIRAGKSYRVPTAGLLTLLGMSAPSLHLPQAPASADGRPGREPEEGPAEATPDTSFYGHGGDDEQPEAAAPDQEGEPLMAMDWLEQWLSQAVLRENSRRSYRGTCAITCARGYPACCWPRWTSRCCSGCSRACWTTACPRRRRAGCTPRSGQR